MLNKKKKAFQILLHVYITDNIWGRVVRVHCCVFIVRLLPILLNTKPNQWLIQKVLIHSRSCWTQQYIWRMLLRNWDVPETDCRDSNNSTLLGIFILCRAAYYLLHTTLHSLRCAGWFSILDHCSVFGSVQQMSRYRYYRKKGWPRCWQWSFVVESWISCPVLCCSSCELLGELLCQEFMGSC